MVTAAPGGWRAVPLPAEAEMANLSPSSSRRPATLRPPRLPDQAVRVILFAILLLLEIACIAGFALGLVLVARGR